MTDVSSYADFSFPIWEHRRTLHEYRTCGCLACGDMREAYGLPPVPPYVSRQIEVARENRLARRSA